MKKHKWKSAVFAIGFIALFWVSFWRITEILSHKTGVNDTVASFYDRPKDSLDVLFVGSSHAYRAFSPMELWGGYGIPSYNLATASQSIPSSYFLIKEGIRRQKPEVIVLEAYGSWYESDYVSAELLHGAVDGIPLNRTKLEFLLDFLPESMEPKECLLFAFPMMLYHGRWQELHKRDFSPRRQFLNGYQYTEKTVPVQKPEPVKEMEPVYENTMEYLEKIISLCEKNHVNLVIALTPLGESGQYGEIVRRANTFMEYAARRGVDCLNFQELADEIGIDFETDFYNPDHMNAFGGDKISRYMANYLTERYGLADRRGEEAYADWQLSYEEYLNFRETKGAKSQDDGM